MTARKRQLSHELLSARQAATQVAEIAGTQQVALVFGTEMSGLSNAELDLCQLLAMIPTDPEFSSLNLAAAVQVMGYEVRMALLDGAVEQVAGGKRRCGRLLPAPGRNSHQNRLSQRRRSRPFNATGTPDICQGPAGKRRSEHSARHT